jgi:hypothetical protein
MDTHINWTARPVLFLPLAHPRPDRSTSRSRR